VKRLILLLLIAMLMVQTVAAALIGTERGSRWLIIIASHYLPGTLTTSDISGTWLAGMNIGELHYQLPKIAIQAEKLQLKLELSELWHGDIHATWLYASNVRVDQQPAGSQTDTAFVLPEQLGLPVTLSIDDVRLQGLSLHHPERAALRFGLVSSTDFSAGQRLRFRTFLIRHDLADISATDGKIELAHPYALKANLRWSSSLAELSTVFGTERLDGEAVLSGSLINLHIQNKLLQPAILSSDISLQPFSPKIDFRSMHQWDKIALMQPPQQPLTLRHGTLELSSENGQLSTRLDATLDTRQLSNLIVSISAEGSWKKADKLQISTIYADSQVVASGSAHWQPGDAGFNLIIHDSHIDARQIHQELTGKLGLTANVSGSIIGDRWNVLSDSIRIEGQLMDRPAQASLNAAASQELISVSGDGSYAGNLAKIDIRINDSIHGSSSLSLNNLEALHPDMGGSAQLQASLTGTRRAPEVDATIAATGLRFRDYLVKGITINARNLGPLSTDMQLDIGSDNLWHQGNMVLRRASAELNGAYSDHAVDFTIEQDGGRLEGSMAGGFQSLQQWTGMFTSFDLSMPDGPPWQLLQPASVELSPARMLLSPLCLSDNRGEACVDYSFDNGRISGSANLSKMPLAPLAAMIGNDINVSGSLDGTLTASRSAVGVWQGQASSSLHNAGMIFSPDTQDYPLIFEEVSVSGKITGDTVTAQANITVQDHGFAKANLTTGLQPETALSGELFLALTELRWLEALLPQLQQNQGHLEGRLAVAGTRQSPRFSGALQLTNGGTDIPVAGLSLNNITAALDGNGAELRLRAEASSGPGTLAAEGRIDLASGLPLQLDMAVRGKEFLAVDLPEARVLIDPDLTLRGSTRLLMLRGNIGIPEASLRPQQLPDVAVKVSDDEIIVSASTTPPSVLAVDTDLMLRLGNDVRFSGFGLDAKLGGNLQLLSAPSRPVALTGELRIDEGRYRAYGQNLEIDRGLLIFQQRLDNPGLDIRAVRRIPSAQIVAGVAITGTLQSPEARLTSEPPMEESEIMAWLLTGRGLAGNSETDNAMIAQALAVYGLEKGSGVTEKIGEKVGLDEISIGSDWETTDASLMLGKQISNRLYLRYAIGLFDALSTVMLRYTVSRRVHLEALSGGDQQSIDLIYQIER
jgi:translocation and assembly module TamB